ncbi:MAG TPA: HAMP domain-containing sensor histidine kinase [Bacillota bacterium]|nr:HAMP domain-containing histidine kinase [Clostridiales bacterium]HPT85038.1 HAMP domain-containing sensor histidine kinase [Bacillota bacterium]
MFKSVFTKYITAFMVIIVISFSILAGIISSQTIQYSIKTKQATVINTANFLKVKFENDIASHLSSLNSEEAVEDFSFSEFINTGDNKQNIIREITTLARYTKEFVFMVTDAAGNLLLTDDYTDPKTFRLSKIDSEIVKELINKQSYLAETTLGGMFTEPYLVHEVPILCGQNVVGMVFVCSSSELTTMYVEVMIKIIIMGSLWVMLAALIAVYFISEKIIGPLKEMSKAAKSFAQGQFDVRVPVVGHDEVAELAVAFNNMAASLERLEDTRRTFLANVSHDLRTPMTSIGGFIDGILDGTIPPEKHTEYLQRCSNEVKRLSRLVQSLLDITRIQAGERKFNKTSFDICEMAREIIISFEKRIEAKNLDVEFECESDKMLAYADRDAIYQVLYNICDNAVKFSREGGKFRIRITTKDKKINVSVYNEGQGIPEEDLAMVFDRFYKSDKSRGLDKTGAGLGLYIAKTIMDAHGEEIKVRSVWGKDCEFIFTLAKGK